jgi:D-3-phosphoglycerate dehydrogenase / 2-oxoglutarate reductase
MGGEMSECTVALTIRSFDQDGPAMRRLREGCRIRFVNRSGKRLAVGDLPGAIGEAEGVIAGTEPFSRQVLEACPRLRIISRVGTGTDSIDLGAARARDIRVFTTPESPVQAVAEHTLALLLSALRGIPRRSELMRKGEEATEPGTLLAGKTAGVIGLGRIGTKVAGMLGALGCRVIAYDPLRTGQDPPGIRLCSSLGDLVEEADILTLHASARPGGVPILDGALLGRCRMGVVIVNTARGSLIDEDALVRALEEGRVAAAGLDVFPREPYTGPLLRFPQVVATPHVASNTIETRKEMEMEAVENLLKGFSGGAP